MDPLYRTPFSSNSKKDLHQRGLSQKQQILRSKSRMLYSQNRNRTDGSLSDDLQGTYFDVWFTNKKLIGQGSFGFVFKVFCKEDNSWYAVKHSKEPYRSYMDRDRKVAEGVRHASLDAHLNIVRCFQCWEEQGFVYMQLELCQCSVHDVLRESRLPEHKVWKYTVHILRALEHLHSRSLVHLDVKPVNILINDNDVAKLSDFSIVIDLTQTNEAEDGREGDSRYMAPEILRGNSFSLIVSCACDVFSLGMTALEMATQFTPPANDQEWHRLRNDILPVQAEELSSSLQAFLHLLMTSDPGERPPVTDILNSNLVLSYLREQSTLMRSFFTLIVTLWTSFCAMLAFLGSYFSFWNPTSNVAVSCIPPKFTPPRTPLASSSINFSLPLPDVVLGGSELSHSPAMLRSLCHGSSSKKRSSQRVLTPKVLFEEEATGIEEWWKDPSVARCLLSDFDES